MVAGVWDEGKGVERNVPICQVLPPPLSPPPSQMMLAADNSQMVRRQQLEGWVGV